MKVFLESVISIVTNLTILIFSFFIPKKKNLAVIGGWNGKRFADNSKYMFIDYIQNYQSSYNLVWVTENHSIYSKFRELGLPVVKKKTLRSLWLHIRAKYHIIDQSGSDVLGWTSYTAERIYLFHGLPIKKLWRSSSSPIKIKISSFLGDYIYDNVSSLISLGGWNDFKLLTPSKYSKEIMYIHCLSKRQLKRTLDFQYPRILYLLNKAIFDNNLSELVFFNSGSLLLEKSAKKKVLYMPTFRDTQEFLILGLKKEEEILDFNNYLFDNSLQIYIKLHPEDKSNNKIQSYSNIVFLDSSIDIYPNMDRFDLLITDYSSIAFDYSVLNKPIIFYQYDKDYYSRIDRGVIFDITDFGLGVNVSHIDDLKKVILKELKEDNFFVSRKEMSEKLFDRKLPDINNLFM